MIKKIGFSIIILAAFVSLAFQIMPANYKDSFTVSGTITKREDFWDRRTNPLMGRPDFLKEIRFQIRVNSVVKGKVPDGSPIITVSCKDRKTLNICKLLQEGKSGLFNLRGSKEPFEFLGFESTESKK